MECRKRDRPPHGRMMEHCHRIQGGDKKGQKPLPVESVKEYQGQQAGLLQVDWQQKEYEVKCGVTAESDSCLSEGQQR